METGTVPAVSPAVKAYARILANAPRNNLPVEVVPGRRRPRVKGSFGFHTTLSGKTIVRHPNAYKWGTRYHCSTQRVEVGVLTLPVLEREAAAQKAAEQRRDARRKAALAAALKRAERGLMRAWYTHVDIIKLTFRLPLGARPCELGLSAALKILAPDGRLRWEDLVYVAESHVSEIVEALETLPKERFDRLYTAVGAFGSGRYGMAGRIRYFAKLIRRSLVLK